MARQFFCVHLPSFRQSFYRFGCNNKNENTRSFSIHIKIQTFISLHVVYVRYTFSIVAELCSHRQCWRCCAVVILRLFAYKNLKRCSFRCFDEKKVMGKVRGCGQSAKLIHRSTNEMISSWLLVHIFPKWHQ